MTNTDTSVDRPTRDAEFWQPLRDAVGDRLLLPDDDGFDDATSAWNLAVQVRPGGVVAAEAAEDVVAAVDFAGGNGLRVAVQNTGHAPFTHDDGVLLVSTKAMDEITVDPDARTVTIGPAAQWKDIVPAIAEHGLTAVTGSAPTVGAVGFLTGGGIGPVSRTLGVGSDRVVSLDVVTGNGELHHVTADDHADLFRGLRGGRATLGIMTRATVELLPLTEVFGGCSYFAADAAADVLHAWQRWSQGLPHEATTSVALGQAPDAPGVPPPLAGKMTAAVRFVWVGEADEGRRLIDGLLAELPAPVLGGYDTMPTTELGSIHNDPPGPVPGKEHGYLLSDLTSESIDALLTAVGPGTGSPMMAVELRQLGGRIADAPASPDVFCGRAASHNFSMVGPPSDGTDAVADAARRGLDALRPWASELTLANFVVSDDPQVLHRYWDDETYAFLSDTADRYDPGHVLDVGQVARTRQ